MKYICDKCNKVFKNQNECVAHENKCIVSIKSENKKDEYIYLKYIILPPDFDDDEIYIYEHPKAIQLSAKNYYNCCPNNRNYDEAVKIEDFDTIIIDDNGDYCIITKNKDENYETECIHKLFSYKKQKMIDYFNDLQEKVNALGKHYKTYRKTI
jgi:hypothetical protein